jgi:hypothetical protein
MSQSLVSLPLATCDLRTRVFAKKLCAERKHMETRHHLLTFAALRRAAVPHPERVSSPPRPAPTPTTTTPGTATPGAGAPATVTPVVEEEPRSITESIVEAFTNYPILKREFRASSLSISKYPLGPNLLPSLA